MSLRDTFDIADAGFVLVVVATLAVAVWACIASEHEWEEFSAAHACKVVGEMTGSTSVVPMYSTDGQFHAGVVTVPSKTGYLCDDGVTYWR